MIQGACVCIMRGFIELFEKESGHESFHEEPSGPAVVSRPVARLRWHPPFGPLKIWKPRHRA